MLQRRHNQTALMEDGKESERDYEKYGAGCLSASNCDWNC